MSSPAFGRPGLWAAAALAAIGAAACGSSGTGSGAAPTTTSGSSQTTAGGAGAANRLTAKESEYHIALSQTALHPGSYVIDVSNAGTTTHSFFVNGPGVSNMHTDSLAPGQSASLTVTLQAGTYEIYCGIDGHKALGMDTHVTVG